MTPLEESRIPLWQLELGAGDRNPTSVWQDIKRERLEGKRPGKQTGEMQNVARVGHGGRVQSRAAALRQARPGPGSSNFCRPCILVRSFGSLG